MCKWSCPRGGNLPGELQARVADQAPTPDRRPSDRALADVDEVTDSALGYLSLEALLGELLERITAAIETDTAAILLLDESRGVLVARAAKGIEEEVRRGVTIPVGAGFAGRIAEQREPLAIPDVNHAEILNPLLRERGIASLLGVPLLVEGRVIGVLHIGTCERRDFTDDDVRLLRVAADRAAMAIDHAGMSEQRHLAEALQRTLMPATLPDAPGVRIAGRYRPALSGARLGGDWYDTFDLPDGRAAIVVGDVVGRGVPAAILMAQMRTAVRAFASEGHGPADVAGRLNDLLLREGGQPTATLSYLALDQETSRVTAVSAGHLPPLLIDAEGQADYLDLPAGPPVGAARIAHFREAQFDVPLGSLLVLYTDGLVERREEPLEAGLERLRTTAAAIGSSSPQAFCDAVLSNVLKDVDQEDDVALIGLQTVPLGAVLKLRLAAEPEVLSTLRRQLARWLQENGVDEQATFDIVLASSEASANATEHAYPPTQGHFDVEAVHDGDHVEIRISDAGSWRPEEDRDHGRGLMLMRGLADEVSIERGDPDGTVVTLRRRVAETAE
jgi:anti-sigma regulatory factor (Ser/Thr protein kinase)/putative methionine-R-sulfoxide reductase with GAF domain